MKCCNNFYKRMKVYEALNSVSGSLSVIKSVLGANNEANRTIKLMHVPHLHSCIESAYKNLRYIHNRYAELLGADEVELNL